MTMKIQYLHLLTVGGYLATLSVAVLEAAEYHHGYYRHEGEFNLVLHILLPNLITK